ncbi:Clan AD, family A22, presenilin-like aspartic peptidase [Tritrichomonas foetus]|uniref:Clan AD, family A22, presenilin-like aspartic peptidase n=1 Tax=Tritrichomonas foetus TaxID=1144522 RepID=A0A1J4K3R3_9EUKA|nr:Clan AD, family A22, presenilin-like aspartic peptidase [Tritrichomonas foetus]|eukprot:OHT05610.1 Clan AD, family A22, presenilin-like aspartic peptidase [Tritrichomonas foetus]
MDSLILGSLAITSVGLGSWFAGTDDEEKPKDVLSESRIKFYPYISAATLIGMNLLIEGLGPQMVNFIFMFYFGLAGTTSVWFFLRSFVSKRFRKFKLFMFPQSHSIITEFVLPAHSVGFYESDAILYPIALFINIFYFRTRNTIANNIIAFCIAFNGVLSIRVDKFTSAAPLLWSLLIYDVFFVYSTDIMTSVAVSIEGPIKLQIRKEHGYSVLGLGDLVIPGIFLSVCSRFDTFIYKLLHRKSPYWIVGMIGYALSMAFTDIVCYLTKSGQPALLFITPAVTVPIVILAFIRKEHYAFLSFSG